ncbi:MAG: CocE/NonD family hydrolase, partial [Brevundimonas sp.]
MSQDTGLPHPGPNYLPGYPFELTITPLPADVLVEDVRIPMRDGVKLAASVFRPASGGKVPVIVTATPYGKDNFNQWNYFREGPEGNVPGGAFYFGEVTISDQTAFEALDPGYWVPRGYAVVLVDHPGMGRSESAPQGQAPALEQRWYDIFDWLASRDWSTGSIGMDGVSALCATQWIAA